ncbi:integral membrane PTH11 [Fusarium albosuccineum]|uniref:Integral membrane PTH11 n=1 Tax=Fusarium albosuccineum TaxID=1237068 RepID=A0A8H4L677_9HYPO|nr:integral membrane PTH11 [Fusarium albosuccineum]
MLHIRQTESGLRRYDSWVERSELRANSSVLPGGAVGLEDTFDNLYTEGSVTKLKSQFVQFVTWAFGPDGVSSLDSIVYGDFGNDNDYSTNLVIVRDRTGDKPFKCLKQGSEQREAIKRFMLYKAQMKLATKISISIILGLGILASIATMVRLPYIKYFAAGEDYLYYVGIITLWSVFESGTGIIAGSLPSLRRLLKNWINFDSTDGHSSNRMTPNAGTGRNVMPTASTGIKPRYYI